MSVKNVSKMIWWLAIVKSVIAVAFVGVVVWSIVAEVSIDDAVLKIVLAVLGAYFGISAKYYWSGRKSRKRGDEDG